MTWNRVQKIRQSRWIPLANDDLGAGAESVEILNIPDPTLEGTLTYIDDLTGETITVAAGAILVARRDSYVDVQSGS